MKRLDAEIGQLEVSPPRGRHSGDSKAAYRAALARERKLRAACEREPEEAPRLSA